MEMGRRMERRYLWTLFSLYLAGLSYLLFFMRAGGVAADWGAYFDADRLNLVPLATIGRYVRALQNGWVAPRVAWGNLLGNLVLFFPMGALLPLLLPGFLRPQRFLPMILALLCAVEALQLLLRCGSCDVDDVLLNLLGASAGYGCAALYRRLRPAPLASGK